MSTKKADIMDRKGLVKLIEPEFKNNYITDCGSVVKVYRDKIEFYFQFYNNLSTTGQTTIGNIDLITPCSIIVCCYDGQGNEIKVRKRAAGTLDAYNAWVVASSEGTKIVTGNLIILKSDYFDF